MCLVHDSPRLREGWEQLVAHTLDPLCGALAQLQSHTRLLVGGIVYRPEPRSELTSTLRPDESLMRVAFAPAPRFLEDVRQVLRTTPMYGLAHLEAASEPVRAPSTLECALADPLAAALEMIDARRTAPPIAPFARSVLRTHHSPVVACHLVHVLALDTGEGMSHGPGRLAPFIQTLPPLLHTQTCLDACTTQELLDLLDERTTSLATVLLGTSNDGSARQRASLAHTAHGLLRSTHRADESVPIDELLAPPWKAPEHVHVLLSSVELARTLRKRPRRAPATESPSKRARGPETPPMPSHKVDAALLNKVVLLQQQQAVMLKNLSRWAVASQASGATGTMQSQMIEQFRQRLAAQQHAIKQQSDRLRTGKSTDLNLLWQALVTIDKEAKEAGLHLGGPSSHGTGASMERSRSRSSAAPASVPAASARAAPGAPPSRSSVVWQGILRWSTGDVNPLFTLLVAMCGSSTAQALLGLPWPNVLTIRALVPVHPPHLQHLIASHRVPCVLLAVRPFPPSLAVRGAENNESNYQALCTMLEQHQRAAYVAHGEPGCGLLIVTLTNAQLGSSNAPHAPRLIAMVFRTPIPFAQLSGADTGAASAPNTRGMISVPPAPGSVAPFVPQAHPTAAAPMGAMNGMLAGPPGLAGGVMGIGMPLLPASVDPVQQLLHSTSLASSWVPSSAPGTAPVPSAPAAPDMSMDVLSPEQLRALGL